MRSTSLDGARGRVLSVGWAFGDDSVGVLTSFRNVVRYSNGRAAVDLDEPYMLKNLWKMLDGRGHVPRVVAHHAEFDVRFLWQRSVILGIRPPRWWPVDAKPWDKNRLLDTMTTWAGHGGRCKLSKICRALGIQVKSGGIDGSKVYDAVVEGRLDEVLKYNVEDVEALRLAARRLEFLPPPAVAVTSDNDEPLDPPDDDWQPPADIPESVEDVPPPPDDDITPLPPPPSRSPFLRSLGHR